MRLQILGGLQVHRSDFHFLHGRLELTRPGSCPAQPHHAPARGLVEGPGHPNPAVRVASASACDPHPLAEERALGADLLLESASPASVCPNRPPRKGRRYDDIS